ncbi:MAG: 5-(carboxyamino)imidazole ribonucleotide synthase [Cytophagales bacterium]|nr:5-(carboxyamino)imidazole ribonucleotide synthase [Cytophagales bacterium]MDW8384255.1 5-(carboxyamino)imidazole ribonucleotide synthase [Flammeovirgaceae bacterium]
MYQKTTICLLGGGQLGRMLLQAGVDLNIEFRVLDHNANAPCASFTNQFVCGSLTDFETVYQFGKNAEIITIEIENVNTNALRCLEQEGVRVFPQPHLIELIQDKRLQKQFYEQNHFPTAPFVLTEKKEDLKNYPDFFPAVHKCGKGGYDGKGVRILETFEDWCKGFELPSVLEKKISIYKEISVIVARNSNGEIKAFPVVECAYHPTQNLVDFLIMPAEIANKLEKRAQEIAIELIQKLELVGILAVEMFIDTQENIFINEVAPRPHNSGHQTIEGNFTSQYAQHLRAILNLPLGNPQLRAPSAMINLLGEPSHEGEAAYIGLEKVLQLDQTYVHLYGKHQTKPYRKMGHITVLGTNRQQLLEKIHFIKGLIKVVSAPNRQVINP